MQHYNHDPVRIAAELRAVSARLQADAAEITAHTEELIADMGHTLDRVTRTCQLLRETARSSAPPRSRPRRHWLLDPASLLRLRSGG